MYLMLVSLRPLTTSIKYHILVFFYLEVSISDIELANFIVNIEQVPETADISNQI